MTKFSYFSTCALISAAMFASCEGDVQQKGQQVTVKVQNGDVKLVRLEVMGEKIIRVSATAESKFADPQSLIIVPQHNRPAFWWVNFGDTVKVSTSEITANVLKSTGEVWFTDAQGNITIDSPEMAQVLEFNRKMVDEGIAVVAPGTYHHAEEFYQLCGEGKVASLVMPFWYIDRFTNYMPDLAGKIATRPLPVWEEGEPRSVGQGGTGTSVTNQAKNVDLVKRFLAYAKLSVDGGIQAWTLCGFDPIRKEVWDMEEVTHADNVFTQYYVTNPFDTLLEIKDEIVGHNNNENLPAALDAMKTNVLYRAYTEENVDIPAMLAEEQAKLG